MTSVVKISERHQKKFAKYFEKRIKQGYFIFASKHKDFYLISDAIMIVRIENLEIVLGSRSHFPVLPEENCSIAYLPKSDWLKGGVKYKEGPNILEVWNESRKKSKPAKLLSWKYGDNRLFKVSGNDSLVFVDGAKLSLFPEESYSHAKGHGPLKPIILGEVGLILPIRYQNNLDEIDIVAHNAALSAIN